MQGCHNKRGNWLLRAIKDEKEIQDHINFIEKEIKVSEKDSRMLELKNWLNYLKSAA